VRWAGVFAPNSPYRKEISLEAEIKKGFQFESADEKDGIKNYAWSKMLAKVFKIASPSVKVAAVKCRPWVQSRTASRSNDISNMLESIISLQPGHHPPLSSKPSYSTSHPRMKSRPSTLIR